MSSTKKNVDLCTILSATYNANSIAESFLERCHNYEQDAQKGERLKKYYCKTCFYLRSRLGGAMITCVPCNICEKELVFGNICVDDLCFDCAKKYKLCAHCGGDINQKNRRKFELEN